MAEPAVFPWLVDLDDPALDALAPCLNAREEARPGFDTAALAPLVCHPAERMVLAALPPAQRQRHFLQLWTHKEAYCKLLDMGLHKDPALLAFGAAPGPAAVTDAQDACCTAWVYPLYPRQGYAASLCLAKRGARPVWVRFRPWPGAQLPPGPALA